MCKIIAFTDTKKLNLKKHLNNIGNELLKLENDGFGYAIQSKTGVFGEKTIAKTFRSRLNATQFQLRSRLSSVNTLSLAFGRIIRSGDFSWTHVD